MKIFPLKPLALAAALSFNASFFGGLALDSGQVRTSRPAPAYVVATGGGPGTIPLANTALPAACGKIAGARTPAVASEGPPPEPCHAAGQSLVLSSRG